MKTWKQYALVSLHWVSVTFLLYLLVLSQCHAYSAFETDTNVAIQHYLAQKQYDQAISTIDDALSRNPRNNDLLYQKAVIYTDLERYQDAYDTLLLIEPTPKVIQLRQKVECFLALLPHNEIGFSQDEYYVSDLKGYWSYSSLHYYRFSRYGTYGGRVNYANRYGQGGEQFVLEAFPRFTKNLTAELLFGLSNTSERVFPHYQYSIEPYYNIQNLEFSLGFRGIQAFNTNIYTYTGSAGVYAGNYFIWLRPYHFTPRSTDTFELGLRRYFSDKNHFITLKLATGKIPDIGDFPPFNQIIIYNANSIAIDGQFSLTKSTFLRLRAGYSRQYYYPQKLLRNITNGGAEILWRF